MLRSLVGSEMCIRDSINAEYGITSRCHGQGCQPPALRNPGGAVHQCRCPQALLGSGPRSHRRAQARLPHLHPPLSRATSGRPGPWEGKQQKHIPVLAAGGGRTLHFKVPHPTSSDHFISHVWAETQTGERFGAHTLEPGDNPEVLMRLPEGAQTVRGFAHCNTHGLWVAEHELSHKEHQGL
eukprot:TRINITY_DN781_c0_g1_i4.p1 TRINITY_DN781_c0_g1~~TRINITY_DN781_c0_g1_i4.p1  ORF type:complete len:182 (-),score=31.40 TRINITY_DN781_c0_g1_i4:164-709(-)